MTASRKPAARAARRDALPVIQTAPPPDRAGEPAPLHRPTRARLQTRFLRRLLQSGSVAEAAAQVGIAPRTVQRWRATNPLFARRYDEALAGRLEILEDLAMRRALGADRRPVFHRGKLVASVERHNDAMLMRLLARFDRLRERQALSAAAGPEAIDDIALLEASSERARQLARLEWARAQEEQA
ncbi:helix-turn-helix domain-containing protein [Reyranella sp.]|uniref:helix-turn-helix domain-containing protein n=1 Tax=Reyranella sp. TaxID=1929291 RepID=UPI003BAD1A9C